MLKDIIVALFISTLFVSSSYADEVDAFDLYGWMETLEGEWVLSSADKQTGTDAYKHKIVLPLVGTSAVGISFKSIGRESTIQEDLLPNTKKQMVTMYHCKDLECMQIKATHYCVKQNQPELIANLKISTEEKIIFDCDMSTEVCQSNEDHVHQIIHELSNNATHLKTSYLSWTDQKLNEKNSIYHFDRKQK